jgi:AraC-like DNA-binding protein
VKTVPKTDPFTISLRTDLRSNHLTLEQAADKAKKSYRQFTRELRGETKQGMMQIETVAELKKEGAISEKTVDAWWISTRMFLRLKK